jgi:cyclophilin family peptidyl-prolyl cis-trans isomerase
MRLNRILCLLALSAVLLSLAMPDGVLAGEGKKNPMVDVKTSMGSFTIELYEKEAPITVKNFLKYVDSKFYDGTIMHRIIPTFVIQGGGFTPDMMKKGTAPPIENEATNGLKNLKYTLSMARTSEVNSATCQFFINVKDNPALDHKDTTARGYGYAVFGKVVKGTEVIDKMKDVETTTKSPYKDVPVTPVIIESMRRAETKEEKPEDAAKEKKAEKE